MKKSVSIYVFIIVLLGINIIPQLSYAQFGPIDPPFWEGGGIQGFGDHVPESCKELDGLRSKISADGLLGTISKIGDLSSGQITGAINDAIGIASGITDIASGGIGSIVGSVLGGILGGGGKKATKKAVEELTKVQMTALVEAECNSILQDIALTMLEKDKLDNINNSEYRKSDIHGTIGKIQNARDNIGYLREYLADEYRLLYDIRGRQQAYEENPGYWREVKDQYADYSIREADKLIISARENQRMTGQTKEYIDVLTGMLAKDDLTPGQSQQLEGYISAIHATEMTEVKNILAGQAGFIAQMESERQQEEKDQDWFQQKKQDDLNASFELFNNGAQSSDERSIVPAWAGEKQ